LRITYGLENRRQEVLRRSSTDAKKGMEAW
jgi:hypothetical protein